MAVTCTACSAALPDGAKFCIECGTAVQSSCSSCGAPVLGGRFCAECGQPLATASVPTATLAPEPSASSSALPTPVAERRLTTVLFADLVGFTPLSEAR